MSYSFNKPDNFDDRLKHITVGWFLVFETFMFTFFSFVIANQRMSSFEF